MSEEDLSHYRDEERAMRVAMELARYSVALEQNSMYMCEIDGLPVRITVSPFRNFPDKMYMVMYPPGENCACCQGSGRSPGS